MESDPNYRRAIQRLERRGIVENGRLTAYGKSVEALPVERAWAELFSDFDYTPDDYLAYVHQIDHSPLTPNPPTNWPFT